MQPPRLIGAIGILALMVGCVPTAMETPPAALPSPGAPEPSPAPSQASTAGPPGMPSEGAPVGSASCDPATAPFRGPDEGFPFPGPLLGADAVAITRCRERYVQQVGRAPVPLPYAVSDWHLAWLAPDGSSAIGLSPGGLLVRRRPPPSSEELLRATGGHGLAMTADGRFAAYLVPPEQPSDALPTLHLLRIDTGEVRTSGRANRVVAWSPDGRKVLVMATLPSGHTGGLAWASWDDPTLRFIGKEVPAAIGARDSVIWAGDSEHIVIVGMSPHDPSSQAGLAVFPLDGTGVKQLGLVDPAGDPVHAYGPVDVQAGNSLIAGHNGLLDPATGIVRPLPIDALPRWSTRPGRLLRWRHLPDGPRLDTVEAPIDAR